MRLDAKAWENLEAAEHLLATEIDDTFPNASASRSYYAAYLAVANRPRSHARRPARRRRLGRVTTAALLVAGPRAYRASLRKRCCTGGARPGRSGCAGSSSP